MIQKRSFKNYILVSVAFHVVIFLSLFLMTQLHMPQKLNDTSVEVSLLSPEELTQLQTIKIPEEPNLIVQSDANNQVDTETKFLSEKNNHVTKQTKAKRGDTFNNSTNKGAKIQTAVAEQKEVKPKAASSKLFNQSFDPYAALVKKDMAAELKKFSAGQTDSGLGIQASTNDRLANVDESLITKLNTKEYKYYGYYHRMRIQLNQWWQPKVREKITKIMRRDRNIAVESDKVTRLVIVLDNKGALVKVQVIGESGFRDLDDAAIEAFRAAAPFPNPPKGIIEADGTVKIRWDFVIES